MDPFSYLLEKTIVGTNRFNIPLDFQLACIYGCCILNLKILEYYGSHFICEMLVSRDSSQVGGKKNFSFNGFDFHGSSPFKTNGR